MIFPHFARLRSISNLAIHIVCYRRSLKGCASSEKHPCEANSAVKTQPYEYVKMVSIRAVLMALAVKSPTVYGWTTPNTATTITLFNSAPIFPIFDHGELVKNDDCSSSGPSKMIAVDVNLCLWGDYPLASKFQINSYPVCENGATPVLIYYDGTSCTGNPNYDSRDTETPSLVNRCLFGTATRTWSMIFRCDNFDSQAVTRNSFKQALPIYSIPERKMFSRAAKDAVITPCSLTDCTVCRPKEPIFLEVNTCFPLHMNPLVRSIWISQPAVCTNSTTALLQTYNDSNCSQVEVNVQLGANDFSRSYFYILDRKCHTTYAKSVAFVCNEKEELRPFKDMPKCKFKDVERLIVPDQPAEEPAQAKEQMEKATSRTNDQAPYAGMVNQTAYLHSQDRSSNSHHLQLEVKQPRADFNVQ